MVLLLVVMRQAYRIRATTASHKVSHGCSTVPMAAYIRRSGDCSSPAADERALYWHQRCPNAVACRRAGGFRIHCILEGVDVASSCSSATGRARGCDGRTHSLVVDDCKTLNRRMASMLVLISAFSVAAQRCCRSVGVKTGPLCGSTRVRSAGKSAEPAIWALF